MDDNTLIIATASTAAFVAIWALYSITMFQGNKLRNSRELEISTKHILEQVEVLFEKEEFALVVLLASKYLERIPKHTKVREYLAKAYYKEKKINNCLKQATKVLKEDPGNTEIQKLLGDCFMQKGAVKKAIKYYESVVQERSDDKDVLYTLAELYSIDEDSDSCIQVLEVLSEILVDHQEIVKVHFRLAELNEYRFNYPAAFDSYKTILSLFPADINANKSLTELYIKLKNYPTAIETLNYMLTLNNSPNNLIWILEHLIDLLSQEENFELAIEHSDKLLTVQGADTFKIKRNIATFNISLGRHEIGINILEELVMMSNHAPDVTIQLANAYTMIKEYDKALEKLNLLLETDNKRDLKQARELIANLYITRAADCSDSGQYEDALYYCDKAEDFNPLSPEVFYQRAIGFIGQKKYSQAVDSLRNALSRADSKDLKPKYYEKLSEIYHITENHFEERRALSDLLKLDENNPIGLYRSGLMHVALHNSKEAEKFFKKALESNPDFINAKYNLALIYSNTNKDKAKELYMEVLEQSPDFEEAKKGLQELSN